MFAARFLISTKNSNMLEDFLINEEVLSPRVRWESTGQSASVHQGLAVMRASNVTFVGIARDLGSGLPNVLLQVESLAKKFKNSRAIFVEGQSDDKTAEILSKWAAASPSNRTAIINYFYDHHEQVGFFKGRKMPREGRLAAARNKALEALYKLPSKTDYVIVIDLDIVGFDPNGVADSFAPRGSLAWDVICANGIMLHGTYRDTFAFRTERLNNTNIHWWDHEPHDLYNLTSRDKERLKGEYESMLHAARAMMDFSSAKGFVRVQSCFGGLAIYKYDSLQGCDYQYRHDEQPYMLDCEHVLLHQCMIRKHRANIFTNTDMKLWYGHGFGGGVMSWTKLRQIMNF